MDNLRPTQWGEYIGQTRMKEELDIRITSAIVEERFLDHVLLAGPAGVGKTALAEMIAHQLGEPLQIVTMPIGIKPLIRIINTFSGVLLLDEIHRCSTKEQETLLPLLEFGYVQDTNGRKVYADMLTVVGATTERGKLIDPLVDRFEIVPEFDRYTDEEMAQIVLGMAGKSGLDVDHDAAMAFGKASAGTPRLARRFVLSYRDLRNSLERKPTHEEVLTLCRTSNDGLTSLHIRYLETLDALGGSKGLAVLSSLLREPTSILINAERLLVEKGFLLYGDRGREITQSGTERIKGPRRSPRRTRETED